MHKTGKFNGNATFSLSRLFLSEIYIWDSNRNYIENLPKEPNLERDKLKIHSLVSNKHNQKSMFFKVSILRK